MEAIKRVEEKHLKSMPVFSIGDTITVNVRITEGKKERIQSFEGIVIAKAGGSVKKTFKVRRVSFGIGVERTFLLNSPFIDSITIKRKGKVRRAKLFYLRKLVGKAAQVKEKKG